MTLTKKRLNEILLEIKATERDELGELPGTVAIQMQTGYLYGYAVCWRKVKAELEKELDFIKESPTP